MPLSRSAEILLNSHDQGIPVNRAELPEITNLAAAAAIQDEIVAARQNRGDVRCGYKIGFTNRTIWDRYRVHHPIWGPVYQQSVHLLDSACGQLDISPYCEPRLEPEIVVALRQVPDSAAPADIARSLAWVAHGFEIVQSAYEGWQFSGAEALAAQGLHGRLLVGPRQAPESLSADLSELPAMLAGLELDLLLDGQSAPVDSGIGSNVLDGPLHAIAHLMTELQRSARTVQAGDIITTGTITDAQPLASGQRWQTRLRHAGVLADLQVDVIRTSE